jgi:hypothetical protein
MNAFITSIDRIFKMITLTIRQSNSSRSFKKMPAFVPVRNPRQMNSYYLRQHCNCKDSIR